MKYVIIATLVLTSSYIYFKSKAKREISHRYIHEPSTFSDVDIQIIRDKLNEIEKERKDEFYK